MQGARDEFLSCPALAQDEHVLVPWRREGDVTAKFPGRGRFAEEARGIRAPKRHRGGILSERARPRLSAHAKEQQLLAEAQRLPRYDLDLPRLDGNAVVSQGAAADVTHGKRVRAVGTNPELHAREPRGRERRSRPEDPRSI